MTKNQLIKELIITNVGTDKMKVVMYLKDKLQISSSEALAMTKQECIVIKEDENNVNPFSKPFSIPQEEVDYLLSIGASIETKIENIVKLSKKKPYQLSELINQIKRRDTQIDKYALYIDTGADEEEYDETLTVYVDKYPDCEEEDDKLPNFVEENNLEYYYSGQQFVDVIQIAINDKPTMPTMPEFVKALEYYSEEDAFMPFS